MPKDIKNKGKKAIPEYGADQIQVLEGLDPVRKRPGMFIGSTGISGLHHLVTEIVNNSMDEAIAGFADHIKVEFFKNGSVAIYDNGRGVPYAIKKEYGVSALELSFAKLHAGGKFGGGGYKVSSGLHGVGASVVNALSEWLRVIVKRGDEVVIQEYENGGNAKNKVHVWDPKNPTELAKNTWDVNVKDWDYESGTIVHFKPDAKIFEETNFEYKFFVNQIREYAYLTAGIKFELVDHREEKKFCFYFEDGVKAFLKSLNRNKQIVNKKIFHVLKEREGVQVEVALQYNGSYAENMLCFANHIRTDEGGTHLTGFRSALTRTINAYVRDKQLIKEKDPNLAANDLREGLTAIVSVKLSADELQFEGQTKGKLGNSNVRGIVESIVKEGLETYLEENPSDAARIIKKNVLALQARIAAKAARQTVLRKNALDFGGGVLPGKLADCTSKDNKKTELFIVEGDSAGGSAKQGRDRKYQAILPLFGKVLNTERARLNKIVDSEKFKDLIVAVGAGIGEQYTPENLRYNRLIIMADADADGMHIMTLYLTFFYRHMKELVENGHIYVAVPPLFKASWGKNKKYLFDEKERAKFAKTETAQKAIIQRFKGLGEMNPEELWETTMNPETRILKQITIKDTAHADEVFTTLMGRSVPPRKRFIQTHAKQANIDIT